MILDDATAAHLETLISEDLRHATIDTVRVSVDETGVVVVDGLSLKTATGKRFGVSDVAIEVYTKDNEWCEADVARDFREELAAALIAPRPEERI